MYNIPEPASYVNEQLQALVDGRRDALLFTPGTPIPQLPQGFTVANTSRGTLITRDKSKVKQVDKGTEAQAGKALFGFGYDQRNGDANIVVQALSRGIPIAEIATNQHGLLGALDAAKKIGAVNVTDKMTAATNRIRGLLE